MRLRVRNLARSSLAIFLMLVCFGSFVTPAKAIYSIEYLQESLQVHWIPYDGSGFSPFGPNGCATRWLDTRGLGFDNRGYINGECASNSRLLVEIKNILPYPVRLRNVLVHWNSLTIVNDEAEALSKMDVMVHFPDYGYGLIGVDVFRNGSYASVASNLVVDAVYIRVETPSRYLYSVFVDYIRLDLEDAIATNTPYPTFTPYPTGLSTIASSATFRPTFTPNPSLTITPGPSRTPTAPPFTKVAPQLSPIATLDTCNRNNLAQPCVTPSAVWPTLDLPTLDLPSPTKIALLPSPTARVVTAIPSPTLTDTPFFGSSVTPIGTPISIVNQPGIDTSSIEQMNEFTRDTFATFMPLGDMSFDVNGTPTGFEQVIAGFGAGVAQPIRIIRSFENTDFNRGAGMITYVIFLFIAFVLTEALVFLIPIIIRIVEFIIQLLTAIKPF